MSWVADGLRHKGIPLGQAMDSAALADAGWVVSAGDTATPVATLSVDDLEHNASAMAAWCARVGADLAPHAKTSLSPELLERQVRHGAWAMTAALPRQAALLWDQGIDRVLVANEVSDPAAVRWLVSERDADPDRRLWLYADSAAGVAQLTAALVDERPAGPLDVLVEIGHSGGRTGARGVAAGLEVARAVAAAPQLRLAGVAAYEGTIGARRDDDTGRAVDAFLGQVGELVAAIAQHRLYEVEQPIVTAGGSVWFDRVATVLAVPTTAVGGRLVLRSGCYLFHDHGLYAAGTPAAAGVAGAPELRPALTVWARVVSRPEPGLALVDAGRRDLSHDAGLPVPLSAHRPGGHGVGLDLVDAGASVSGLSDQHAFVQLPAAVDVRVGDLVRLGISHPCTTLDRWPVLLLVDADHAVVGAVRTQF
jgi:D-serine deaminase-like pyridoxal phosphate-dependent protein